MIYAQDYYIIKNMTGRCPWSLGRLSKFLEFPDRSVFIILGGPLSSYLIVYANEMTQAK